MNKLFEMLIDNDLTDGVFAISLVDSPAIEEDFILLSKDKMTFDIKLEKILDKKRRVVCGPILVPDLIIPRKGYDIVFRKDTVRKLSEKYLMDGNKDNVTIQHKIAVNKVFMIENWIVEDPKNDKSNALGFDVPAGTWFGSFKIEDEQLWNEYLETGILKGFSLEGNFTQQEIQLKNEFDIDKELFNIYLAINYTPADLDKYYVWKLGEVEGKEHCPICLKNNNKVRKLREWLKYGIPAVPHGTPIAGSVTDYATRPYAQYCEDKCNCSLIHVNAPEIKRNIIKPF